MTEGVIFGRGNIMKVKGKQIALLHEISSLYLFCYTIIHNDDDITMAARMHLHMS